MQFGAHFSTQNFFAPEIFFVRGVDTVTLRTADRPDSPPNHPFTSNDGQQRAQTQIWPYCSFARRVSTPRFGRKLSGFRNRQKGNLNYFKTNVFVEGNRLKRFLTPTLCVGPIFRNELFRNLYPSVQLQPHWFGNFGSG